MHEPDQHNMCVPTLGQLWHLAGKLVSAAVLSHWVWANVGFTGSLLPARLISNAGFGAATRAVLPSFHRKGSKPCGCAGRGHLLKQRLTSAASIGEQLVQSCSRPKSTGLAWMSNSRKAAASVLCCHQTCYVQNTITPYPMTTVALNLKLKQRKIMPNPEPSRSSRSQA